MKNRNSLIVLQDNVVIVESVQMTDGDSIYANAGFAAHVKGPSLFNAWPWSSLCYSSSWTSTVVYTCDRQLLRRVPVSQGNRRIVTRRDRWAWRHARRQRSGIGQRRLLEDAEGRFAAASAACETCQFVERTEDECDHHRDSPVEVWVAGVSGATY